MQLEIYAANCTGDQFNCLYPNKVVAEKAEELAEAVKRDHVAAQYKNSYRNKANFLQTTCVVMDCDNDHSEEPDDWVTIEELPKMLVGISFAAVPSRNHNKEKNGKPARERFHVYFPISTITDEGNYGKLKRGIQAAYPWFDANALDSARFIYGSDSGEVLWHEGVMNIDAAVEPLDEPYDEAVTGCGGSIRVGGRNNYLSRFAARVLKKYGDESGKAKECFLQEAAKCEEPLEREELRTIWGSALRFYNKVKNQKGYVAPDEFNTDFGTCRPDDYSDYGQAVVFAKEYNDAVKFNPAIDFLAYDGKVWIASKVKALGVLEDFLDLQLADAREDVETTRNVCIAKGITDEQLAAGKRARSEVAPNLLPVFDAYLGAVAYLAFALKRRDFKYMSSALQAVKPLVYIEYKELDGDELLLNTPSGTYRLDKGFDSLKTHDAKDYITKITEVVPSDEGMELWLAALDVFFCSDADLIAYVQMVVGKAAVGKVYAEEMIIAYGEGRNGKSTFWNVIAKVLGTYSGAISADALTVGCRRNVKPEMAELKGKRLVIAAELEEGVRLNTSVIKQLCSTDDIRGERKYCAPESFTPSHTLVLYTNHLPKVGANDAGTWRRLKVIPFNAVIEGKSDIKNYADYLFEKAGGAILKWVIEGAQKVIARGFKVEPPKCVVEAIKAYRESQDWMGQYLEANCIMGNAYRQKSGELYQNYRQYCLQTGDYTRSTTDFYAALETAGFRKVKNKNGSFIIGLMLKCDVEDFLQ